MGEFNAYECAILHALFRNILWNDRHESYSFRPLDAEQRELLERLSDKLIEA